MTKEKDNSLANDSLVLSDWAAKVEFLGLSIEAVVHELLVLSLLYEKILVQDEVFALSNKLAGWLAMPERADLIRKLFDLGCIVVLTHPEAAYLPKDEDLRDLSYKRPIAARAAYLQRRSTKEEDPFAPSQVQERLYDQIDACLRESPASRRPVRSPDQPEPTEQFLAVLRDVLSRRHYRLWLDSAFSGISESMADDFVAYIEDPETLVERAKGSGRYITLRPGLDGRPVFNRSLGYQAADLYPPRQAESMQRLIQTCFAAPFCASQRAIGRYSQALRELLLLPADLGPDIERQEEIVSVESVVDISLVLPPIDGQFVEGIRSVRESAEGQRLRQSIRRLGEDPQFTEQVDSWRAVADKLATAIIPLKQVTVRSSLVTLGNRAFAGAILGGLASAIRGAPISLPDVVKDAFLAEGIGLLYDHGREIVRNAYERQEIREQLDQAVAFRCVDLPMPPVALPKVC